MEQGQKFISGQIRAARGLLDISQAILAKTAGVSSMTVKRAEGSGSPFPADKAITAIQEALVSQGIQFLDEGDSAKGPGVVLVKNGGQ